MEIQGVVHNGVVVPDDATALVEGNSRLDHHALRRPAQDVRRAICDFKGAIPGLPSDLAQQHDHYRLGTPKR